MEYGSKQVAKAAIKLAVTETRDEENEIISSLAKSNIKSVAIDFGANVPDGITKILERAVVASRREGVIGESHAEEGAVVGAAHEAIRQIVDKSIGLNIGGKIAIARYNSHISVCVFFAVGLLNLNDVSIGLGHRAI
ncbi:MAG: HutP family protein [Clostridia bacterium]|nr:HutP family protein [Clostridia bacterium]